jgi:hypothetical protein
MAAPYLTRRGSILSKEKLVKPNQFLPDQALIQRRSPLALPVGKKFLARNCSGINRSLKIYTSQENKTLARLHRYIMPPAIEHTRLWPMVKPGSNRRNADAALNPHAVESDM